MSFGTLQNVQYNQVFVRMKGHTCAQTNGYKLNAAHCFSYSFRSTRKRNNYTYQDTESDKSYIRKSKNRMRRRPTASTNERAAILVGAVGIVGKAYS